MDKNGKWKWQWKNWVTRTRVPGLWKRKEGGYVVRARVVDPTTGRTKEIKKVFPHADAATAFKWLQEERNRIKAGVVLVQPQSVRFCDYAVSLLEKKASPAGKIKSAASRSRWKHTLEHLIGGTNGEKARAYVPGFGEMFIDKIAASHIENWKTGIGTLIAAGDYAPTTANGWLGILRVIIKAAKREYQIANLATDGVENFDTSEHVTYPEEAPNALPPDKVGEFLRALHDLYPQFYAMTCLGLGTGLRPSSLRPLRRQGIEPDVLWEQNRMLVRRSQTRGTEVMNTTKQKRRYTIYLPEQMMDILRWHVATQLSTPEQMDSDLLFPSTTGSFRAPTVLNKPFAEVAEAIGLGFRFTQRGLRRTFNDLARAAKVEAIVTRSISGHLTERMQEHYSTVNADEQREGMARIIDLFAPRSGTASGAPSGAPGASSGAPTSTAPNSEASNSRSA